MGPYVADFCSVKARLVIEIDGGQHQSNQVLDLVRSGFMEKKGYRVVRIWNHEVLTELEAVLEELDRTLTALTLDPLIDVPTHKSGRWLNHVNSMELTPINGRGKQTSS
jgi:Golgi nucleoside diphosphatase